MARNQTLEFLHDTFNDCYDNQDTIKRTTGVINYLVEDSHGKLADVQIGTKHLVLFNKSGEILEEGDHVWVYYWNALADGYIALRCGEAKNIGGGIKNAGVLTERQDTVYSIAKDVAIVDAENKAKAYYTDANNVILIDGYTAVATSVNTYPETSAVIDWSTETEGAIDLKERIADMNPRLFSNKVKSYWIPTGASGFVTGNEYTYYLQIYSIYLTEDTPATHGYGWVYSLGLFCEELPYFRRQIPSVISETPYGLEDCGLITIYDTLYAPVENLYGNKPTANAALAVCASGNARLYGGYIPEGATTPSYKRVTGLVYGFPMTNVPFRDVDEFNYAISLTTERDIVSGA